MIGQGQIRIRIHCWQAVRGCLVGHVMRASIGDTARNSCRTTRLRHPCRGGDIKKRVSQLITLTRVKMCHTDQVGAVVCYTLVEAGCNPVGAGYTLVEAGYTLVGAGYIPVVVGYILVEVGCTLAGYIPVGADYTLVEVRRNQPADQ